jgi:hypothetical protein
LGEYKLRKTVSILIAIVLLILTGCSNREVINHNYTYKGENEFWTVEYKVTGTGIFTGKGNKTEYEANSNQTLTVSYRKNLLDLSSVKHLEISYKSSSGGGKLIEDFDENHPLNQKTYTFKTFTRGGAIENKNEIIKVNINLDGNVQTIELKNEKS